LSEKISHLPATHRDLDLGLPADFLVARLRGRCPHILRDWETLAGESDPAARLAEEIKQYVEEFGGEGGRLLMHHEYRWVHGRMNKRLRAIFQPYFLYFDLRAMLRSLRHREQADTRSVSGHSPGEEVIDHDLRRLLRSDRAMATLPAELETRLVSLAPEFAGLARVYKQQGLPPFEEELFNRFFAFGAGRSAHPVIGEFLAFLAGVYNTIALSKMARWSAAAATGLLPPGLVIDPVAGRLKPPGDPAALFAGTGLPGQPRESRFAAALEIRLLTHLTRRLRRQGRIEPNVAFILLYLWEIYLQGRNLGIIIHGRPVQPDKIPAVLVQ